MNPTVTASEYGGLTVADFWLLPEGPPYFQLIDGDLYMSPSPNRRHQKIILRLASLIHEFLETTRLGEIYISPSDVALLDQHVLNPDLYFVSRERGHLLTEQGCDGPPDLVVEILSQSTARLDAGRKREIYAESGVTEMWIISPRVATVEIWRFQENALQPARRLTVPDSLSTALLPGLVIDLAPIFAD